MKRFFALFTIVAMIFMSGYGLQAEKAKYDKARIAGIAGAASMACAVGILYKQYQEECIKSQGLNYSFFAHVKRKLLRSKEFSLSQMFALLGGGLWVYAGYMGVTGQDDVVPNIGGNRDNGLVENIVHVVPVTDAGAAAALQTGMSNFSGSDTYFDGDSSDDGTDDEDTEAALFSETELAALFTEEELDEPAQDFLLQRAFVIKRYWEKFNARMKTAFLENNSELGNEIKSAENLEGVQDLEDFKPVLATMDNLVSDLQKIDKQEQARQNRNAELEQRRVVRQRMQAQQVDAIRNIYSHLTDAVNLLNNAHNVADVTTMVNPLVALVRAQAELLNNERFMQQKEVLVQRVVALAAKQDDSSDLYEYCMQIIDALESGKSDLVLAMHQQRIAALAQREKDRIDAEKRRVDDDLSEALVAQILAAEEQAAQNYHDQDRVNILRVLIGGGVTQERLLEMGYTEAEIDFVGQPNF